MKWYTFLIAIALLFVQCGGDDDSDDNWGPEYIGSVNMKINGRSYTLKVWGGTITYQGNFPEEGILGFGAVDCRNKIDFYLNLVNDFGEQEIMPDKSLIRFDYYNQTGCGWDSDESNQTSPPIEYFKSGTVELIELGERFEGTFSGITESSGGGQRHEITEGYFEFTLRD
ncbi:hypothetical protein [Lutimonas zeaxanthinifaciens]|uniref:hypothetical protein n=1 Tax=Lutimonas zeaxanthinifaciens TaxID=3060215 RepID=UPI00265CD218|nr:hypothetical protein [Lutimonas sp. YSD2104]WKK66514.1 hypothetical protein QZH61_02570 [Lutimonas sp. YSD2104]